MIITQDLKDWGTVQYPELISLHANPELVEHLNSRYPEVDIESMEFPVIRDDEYAIIAEAGTRSTDFSVPYDSYVALHAAYDSNDLAVYIAEKAMDYIVSRTGLTSLRIMSIICLEVDADNIDMHRIWFAVRGIY